MHTRLHFNEDIKGNVSHIQDFLNVYSAEDLPFQRIGIKTRGQVVEFAVNSENYTTALFLYYCLIREGDTFIGGAFYFTKIMKLEACYYFGSEICFDVLENTSSSYEILKLLLLCRSESEPISVIFSKIDRTKLRP